MRTKVYFINPPNTYDEIANDRGDGVTVSRGQQHTDWANFPHLGILSLASAIDVEPTLEAIYIDGVLFDIDEIVAHIRTNVESTLAVGLSSITANHMSAIMIARSVKELDPNVTIIMGNDHFTALREEVLLANSGLIDCGFSGNEVHGSLRDYLLDRQRSLEQESYPSMVKLAGGDVVIHPRVNGKRRLRLIDFGGSGLAFGGRVLF